MSRINTNVSSLIAQRALAKNQNNLNTSLQRLSTGLQINSGKDNPAGLIASQNLKAETAGITTAIDNANRASNILGTAEGGLSEVSNLLTELQGLVSQSANTGGLSNDEIAANQLQVDSILSTVNRIAGSTSFQGAKLLNGNLDYTTSSVATSAVTGLQVNSAAVPSGTTATVVVTVVASASTGKLTSTQGATSGNVSLAITGNLGSVNLSFGSNTSVASVVTAINADTSQTGVSASTSGGALVVNATTLGAENYVSVKTLSGTYAFNAATSKGTDATVTVNGAAASANGNNVSYRTGQLDVSFSLSAAFNANGATTTFGITGGGATFSLGSKVTDADKASIGISSVSTGSLGNNIVGFLSTLGSGGANSLTSNNLVQAQKVLDAATNQVSSLRGRIGAFQKFTIGSTVNALGVAYENASAAESAISDTDFAAETANLTRAQILSSSAQTVLRTANSAPSSVLSLLQ